MGTRSLTILHGENAEIAVMYRQFDGYPSDYGQELIDFLSPFTMVNGLTSDSKTVANGPQCLASLLVSHFKGDTPGDIYLHPAGTRDIGEEYTYHVKPNGKTINLTVFNYSDKRIFDGPVDSWELTTVEKADS